MAIKSTSLRNGYNDWSRSDVKYLKDNYATTQLALLAKSLKY